MHIALYARVSTHDQQTLPMQLKAMRQYAKKRGWKIIEGSGSRIGSEDATETRGTSKAG